MANAKPRLAFEAAVNWLAFAAQIVAGFYLAPFVLCHLGDARYGVWSFIESLAAYLLLADLGVSSFLVRSVARCRSTGDGDGLNRIITAALTIFLAGAVVLAGLALLLAPRVGDWLRVPAGGSGEVTAFALIMLLSLTVILPLTVFSAALEGLHRFALKGAIRTVVLLVRIAATLAVMTTSPGLVSLGLILAGCSIVEHLVMVAAVFVLLPGLRVGPRWLDAATFRGLASYSAHSFVAMISGRIAFQTDALVIGVCLSAASVTPFAFAARLTETAKNLLRTLTSTLTPAISSLEAAGDEEAVRRLVLTATRTLFYLVLPIQLGLVLYGRPFLEMWTGSGTVAIAADGPLVVLTTTMSLAVLASVCARTLYGLGRLEWLARAAVIEAVLNLTLSLLLVGPLGLLGVAIGTAVPNVLFCVLIIGYTLRLVGQAWGEYLRQGLLPPLLAALVPVLTWRHLIDRPVIGWAELIGQASVGVATYAVAVLLLELPSRLGGEFWSGAWRWAHGGLYFLSRKRPTDAAWSSGSSPGS